jgi:predicted nucleotidyltransferase
VVPIRDIRAFARRIAAEFKPRRIILFGSYACGRPTEDSDVDLLVVMPYRGHPTEQAIEIRRRIERPFALDLLVRSPGDIKRRIALKDGFIREIVEQGKVLYDAGRTGMGRKGRRRLPQRGTRNARSKGAQL